MAALKITVGLSASSKALIGDGIDSLADVLIAIITLIVGGIIARPADKGHPWGHGRAETVATALLSFIIFFAGAQLILDSCFKLFRGQAIEVDGVPALITAGISIGGKLLLARVQYVLGKKADSAIIKANAKNMVSDVLMSVGVLAGLGAVHLSGRPEIDFITAILVGAWVLKTAIGIFLEANLELMDGGVGTESYKAVFEAVKAVQGAGRPHRTRMRKVAGFWDIDIDIEVDPKLTVEAAHLIASKVEAEIKRTLANVYDIMIHIEPNGDWEANSNEGYGLSEKEMSEE